LEEEDDLVILQQVGVGLIEVRFAGSVDPGGGGGVWIVRGSSAGGEVFDCG
jgi:hypothetical protein